MMLWPLMAISPMASGSLLSAFTSSQLPGSISFISTPGIGIPIEPTRGSSPYGENDATGEVSDSP